MNKIIKKKYKKYQKIKLLNNLEHNLLYKIKLTLIKK